MYRIQTCKHTRIRHLINLYTRKNTRIRDYSKFCIRAKKHVYSNQCAVVARLQECKKARIRVFVYVQVYTQMILDILQACKKARIRTFVVSLYTCKNPRRHIKITCTKIHIVAVTKRILQTCKYTRRRYVLLCMRAVVARLQACEKARIRTFVVSLYTCENRRRHELVFSLYTCKYYAYVTQLVCRRSKLHVYAILGKSVNVRICSQTCFGTFVDV